LSPKTSLQPLREAGERVRKLRNALEIALHTRDDLIRSAHEEQGYSVRTIALNAQMQPTQVHRVLQGERNGRAAARPKAELSPELVRVMEFFRSGKDNAEPDS
jgi:hypothetical protein